MRISKFPKKKIRQDGIEKTHADKNQKHRERQSSRESELLKHRSEEQNKSQRQTTVVRQSTSSIAVRWRQGKKQSKYWTTHFSLHNYIRNGRSIPGLSSTQKKSAWGWSNVNVPNKLLIQNIWVLNLLSNI